MMIKVDLRNKWFRKVVIIVENLIFDWKVDFNKNNSVWVIYTLFNINQFTSF